ncbi:acylphosphatase, partial [Klebsiella variicola subsp. variicola]
MKMGREYIIQGRVQGVGFRFFTYQWMKKQPIT